MKPHQAIGKHSRERSPEGARHEAGLLLTTMADTTWRIFVPVLLLTALGIWLDLTVQTKPWITFTGVALGAICAVWLVRAQLKKVQK